MRQLFQILGILTLLLGSFLFSDKVSLAAIQSDELLNEVNEKKEEYKEKAIEATIDKDTIVPGKNGQEINVKESYKKMRQIGYFNEKLLVYKDLPVKEPLNKNFDKYIISGNKTEKSVSLIIKVDSLNINNLIKNFDKYKIKGTFYITSGYFENNNDQIINLIQTGHTIGNLSNKEDYKHSDFIWMKTILTSLSTQHYNYCYTKDKNPDILKICSMQKSYTIIPTSIIDKRPFINIKQNLKPGAIISLENNEELNKEIENIINYINSKGYEIKSLEKFLEE